MALVFLLFLISNSLSEETNAIPSPFDTYKNENFRFQISYPKDWRTGVSVNDAVWKIAKTTTNEIGSISISVARYTGKDPSFLQNMLEQEKSMVREMQKGFPGGKFVEKGKTYLGSFPAVYFKSEYTVKNLNTENKITMVQIFCVRDSLLYVVSFETTESSYQKTQPQFQAIISTFIFTNTGSASPATGIKAFEDLFFGEERAKVEKKQKKQVKVGENLFELSCEYENIGGQERLSKVNLFATWTDVQESAVNRTLDEIKETLSTKFGDPSWQIRNYEGRIGVYELNKSNYLPSSYEGMQSFLAKYEDDLRFVLQLQWKTKEEKIVNVLMRDRNYNTERKEKVETQAANWFRDAKYEEVTCFDKHREFKIWIQIESPVVKNMKAKEDTTSF